MQADEKRIVEGLVAGDESAYRYVFTNYYEQMCILACSILHDDFLAESTVSDVISHIYEIREELSIRTNLRSYLLTCTRNACINALGTKVKRTEQTFNTLPEDDVTKVLSGVDTVTPQGVLLDNELADLMSSFIEGLPEPTRTTFIKSRYEGMTYREIAAEEGISANTVKFRVKNVLQLLQTRFSKYLQIMILFCVCRLTFSCLILSNI